MAEFQTIQEEQISTKDLFKKIIGIFTLIGNEWRLLLISIALGTLLSIILDVKELKDTEYEYRYGRKAKLLGSDSSAS